MEFKGTPAPWYVVERPDRDGCIHTATLEDENDNEIANLGLNVDHYDMLLIKAAPELLEALQSIQQSMAKYIEVANNIGVEALADGFYLGHAIDVEEKAKAVIAKALVQQ